MKRYARRLSFVGLALTAWSVFWQTKHTWAVLETARQVEIDFPWLGLGLAILAILQLAGAATLLRRLAQPAQAGRAVRWLARFWAIFALCMVGLSIWAQWLVIAAGYSPDPSPFRFFWHLAEALALAGFRLCSLPPLWVLSRQGPPLGSRVANGPYLDLK